jgi:putative sigma-54 modulation protein
MKLQVTSVHFDADQKLIDYIEKKAAKLTQFFDRIIDAQVHLKLENSGQIRDKIVELKLMIPGDTLVAKEVNKTFEAATDEVIDTMKRQLTRHKEKLQLKGHASKLLPEQ